MGINFNEGEAKWFHNRSRKSRKRDQQSLHDSLTASDPSRHMGWVIDYCKKWEEDLDAVLSRFGWTLQGIREKGEYWFPENGFWDETTRSVRGLDKVGKLRKYVDE